VVTPLDVEIRSRLTAVLAGEANPRDFYDWFIPATLEVEATGSPEAIRLSHDLIHLFAERSAGMLTGAELRAALEETASTHLVTATPWNRAAGPPMWTRSSSDTIEDRPAAFLLRRRHAEAIA
jgi:hypothetical protein